MLALKTTESMAASTNAVCPGKAKDLLAPLSAFITCSMRSGICSHFWFLLRFLFATFITGGRVGRQMKERQTVDFRTLVLPSW